jgi:membrane protease YdiL (CAAX protease family)
MPLAAPPRVRGVRWVARHPVAALLGWSFTVGQAVAFVPLVASSRGVQLPVQPFTSASTWVGLLLPALALTWLLDGRAGMRALLGRVVAVRRPVGWYAFSLVVVPLLSLVIAVGTAGTVPETTPVGLVRAWLFGFGLQAVLHLVTNNLWEELAWTGFVQARLQTRHSAMVAAVITAPLFALQHAPLVVGNSLIGGLVVLAALVVLAVPFRAAMAWIDNRTGSLFLVGLAHACGNAVVTGTVAGNALLPALFGRNLGPVHLFAFAVIGVVLIVRTRGRLGLASLETPDPPLAPAVPGVTPAGGPRR